MQLTHVFGEHMGWNTVPPSIFVPFNTYLSGLPLIVDLFLLMSSTNGLENHNVWRYRFDLNEVYLSAPRLLGVYSRNRHKVHLQETESTE